MKDLSPFCTCTDRACPAHPSNHEKGCAPCIRKNLEQREIPSCFFNSLGARGRSSYFFEDFAQEVLLGQTENSAGDPDGSPSC